MIACAGRRDQLVVRLRKWQIETNAKRLKTDSSSVSFLPAWGHHLLRIYGKAAIQSYRAGMVLRVAIRRIPKKLQIRAADGVRARQASLVPKVD